MAEGINKMTIKLVALDLDHTLLNEERRIDDYDLEAIQKARNIGVHFTIATGRMYIAAKEYGKYLNIDIPVITYQGSLIKKLMSSEEILHLRISNQVAHEAIELAKDKKIHINVYDGDSLYVFSENDLIKRYKKVNGITAIVDPEFDKKMNFSPTKVAFVDDNVSVLDELENELNDRYLGKYDVTRSFPHLLELGHKDATKSKALEFLSERLGIKQSETMAIGDGVNDIDMIQWAGVGVAMGNASEIVKKCSDWVTSDNENGGVAKAIEKFVLKAY
jgi:Cof subfamily protein (haloacid dehalogenase superfamily)